MLFRVLLFILLVVIGYFLSRKVHTSRISASIIVVFLGLSLVFFTFLSKRVLALWGFSFYLVIIVIGLLVGFLAGMKKKNQLDR
jgi:Ca2+/Na+ antiporter